MKSPVHWIDLALLRPDESGMGTFGIGGQGPPYTTDRFTDSPSTMGVVVISQVWLH